MLHNILIALPWLAIIGAGLVYVIRETGGIKELVKVRDDRKQVARERREQSRRD